MSDLSPYYLVEGDTNELVEKLNAALAALGSDTTALTATYTEGIAALEASLEAAHDSDVLAINSTTQGLSNRIGILEADGVPANAIIPAILKTYNLANVKHTSLYTGENSNGWELKTDLAHNNEDKPSGEYIGQFASHAAAVTGGADVEDWYYNTADTYFYEITNSGSGTEAGSRIYRAGSLNLPLARLAVIVETGSNERLIIFDLTKADCPMWMERTAATTILGTDASTTYCMEWADDKLFAGCSAGLYWLDFSEGTAKRINSGNGFFLHENYLGDGTTVQGYSIIRTAPQLPNANARYLKIHFSKEAPISPFTGMPLPHVIIGSDSGVSVLFPDLTIKNSSLGGTHSEIYLSNGVIFSRQDDTIDTIRQFVRPEDFASSQAVINSFNTANSPPLSNATFATGWDNGRALFLAHADGLDIFIPNIATQANYFLQKLGEDHNTGPMIKPLASVMCDVATGDISDTGLITGNTSSFTSGVGNWTSSANATISNNSGNGRLTIDTGGSTGVAYLTVTGLTAGASYNFGVIIGSETLTGNWEIRIGTGAGTYDIYRDTGAPTGSQKIRFTATQSTMYFSIATTSAVITGEYIEFDSVNLSAAVTDYSGEGSHFDVEGTLSRAANVTGGIAIFSGFGQNNYLELPYSADNDLSAGATISFVGSIEDISSGYLSVTSGNPSDSYPDWYVEVNSSGACYVTASSNGSSWNDGNVTAAAAFPTEGIHHLALVADASEYKFYIDGVYTPLTTIVTNSGILSWNSDTDSVIRCCRRASTSTTYSVGVAQALVKIHKKALTPAEVMHLYKEDMSIINNGDVTLDNAITAGHYDERNGDSRILDGGDEELILNGSHIRSSRDPGVGTVEVIDNSFRANAIGGSTGLLIEVEENNLREPQPRKTLETFTIEYTGDSSRVEFPLQSDPDEVAAAAGARPIAVIDNGDPLVEGSSDDWEEVSTGLGYYAELAVAPGVNSVVVQFEKEVYR